MARQNTQSYTAYQALKQKVLSGAFAPEQRLREKEVAALLGLGRTPVREALKRLEDEGLLTLLPRIGLVVTRFNREQVAQIYSMREMLEGAAAEFAAHHASGVEIENLRSILAESGQPGADPVRMNLLFHEAIYSAAHNTYLIASLRSLLDTTYLLGQSTLSSPARVRLALSEHKAIAKAICDRDADAAYKAARHHMRQAFRARLKLLRDEEQGAAEDRVQDAN